MFTGHPEPAPLALGTVGSGQQAGQLCPWLWLGVGWKIGSCIRRGGPPLAGSAAAPSAPASLLPPSTAELRSWLSSLPPNPALLSQAKTPPCSGSAWSRLHLPVLCLSYQTALFLILPPVASRVLGACTFTRPRSLLSLPLSPRSALSSGCLPPSSSVLFRPSPPVRMAFLAGEPPPRPPQPAFFTQSKWGCSRCLGPRPRPLSLTPLLEGTEPGQLGGRGGWCVL